MIKLDNSDYEVINNFLIKVSKEIVKTKDAIIIKEDEGLWTLIFEQDGYCFFGLDGTWC